MMQLSEGARCVMCRAKSVWLRMSAIEKRVYFGLGARAVRAETTESMLVVCTSMLVPCSGLVARTDIARLGAMAT